MKDEEYILNIGLHVLILFTFLSTFFFCFASKLASNTINKSLSSVLTKEIDSLLTKIDTWDQKLKPESYPNIRWDEVNKIAQDISKKSQGDLVEIKENNQKLLYISIAIICFLFISLVGLYLYYKQNNKQINILHIVTENLVFFMIIGIIEAIFFIKIASQYIPVTPDFVSITLLDRVKYNINKKLVQQKLN